MLTLMNLGWLICLVLVIAYYLVQWVGRQPFFAITTVRIESSGTPLHQIDPQSARAQVLNTVQGNFFNVNLAEIRDAFKAMPWIRNAQVRRRWPNTLVIRVEEYQVLGRWGEQGFLSSTGDVFEAPGFSLQSGPQFNGPEGSSAEVLRRYRLLTQGFQALDLHIESLSLSDRLAWHLVLTNGMHIELGRDLNDQTIDNRVRRLLQVWPRVQKNSVREIKSIDLRYPNGFALGLVN